MGLVSLYFWKIAVSPLSVPPVHVWPLPGMDDMPQTSNSNLSASAFVALEC